MFYNHSANFLEFLPQRLQQVREMQALSAAINPEFKAASDAIAQITLNSAVATANAQGVARWEKILGVSTPRNSTLLARKEALRAKLMTKPPINNITLKGIIEAYMGVAVDITVDAPKVKVTYRGTARVSDLTPLFATIYETIPANMLVEIVYRYLAWAEFDALALRFEALDALQLDWNEFERGEWID